MDLLGRIVPCTKVTTEHPYQHDQVSRNPMLWPDPAEALSNPQAQAIYREV